MLMGFTIERFSYRAYPWCLCFLVTNLCVFLLQTDVDEATRFSYRVTGSSAFTVLHDGYVIVNSDSIDYESVKEITFKVSPSN